MVPIKRAFSSKRNLCPDFKDWENVTYTSWHILYNLTYLQNQNFGIKLSIEQHKILILLRSDFEKGMLF